MRINAAHPFILIVAQSGNVKFATRFETPTFFCAHLMVSGNAVFDDFDKNATSRAGAIPRAVLIGEMR